MVVGSVTWITTSTSCLILYPSETNQPLRTRYPQMDKFCLQLQWCSFSYFLRAFPADRIWFWTRLSAGVRHCWPLIDLPARPCSPWLEPVEARFRRKAWQALVDNFDAWCWHPFISIWRYKAGSRQHVSADSLHHLAYGCSNGTSSALDAWTCIACSASHVASLFLPTVSFSEVICNHHFRNWLIVRDTASSEEIHSLWFSVILIHFVHTGLLPLKIYIITTKSAEIWDYQPKASPKPSPSDSLPSLRVLKRSPEGL